MIRNQRHRISLIDLQNQYIRQIARRKKDILVEAIRDNQHRVITHAFDLGKNLGLRRLYSDSINNGKTVFPDQLGKNRRRFRPDTFSCSLSGVKFSSGLFRKNTATASPQRRGRHTGTCPAGTLLPERFCRGVLDLSAIFLCPISTTRIRLVGDNDLMNQRLRCIPGQTAYLRPEDDSPLAPVH